MLIAEVGQNHNGDIKVAKKMIRIAKDCGADMVKFQLYDVDSIFSKDFQWYKEAKEAQLNFKDTKDLKKECDEAGVEFSASVFDLERLGWVLDLGVRLIKIASRSVYNKELIDAASASGKDLIVSLGMYKEKEFPRINTKGKVDFLYCVAKYPTAPEDIDFSKVDFKKYSGFSDHTVGTHASLAAIAQGARIIEKHFTLDKNMHGPDHKGSMDPEELKYLADFWHSMKLMLKEKK